MTSDPYPVAGDVYGMTLDAADTLSAYVIDDETHPTVVETGTAATAEALLAGIRDAGIDPGAIRYAIVGHYHLDHVGGAEALLEAAPECTLVLHESMATWVTDPERFDRLVESTADALGAQFDDMGAPARSLPADRIETVTGDVRRLELARGPIEVVHTPGHTQDHLSAYLPDGRVLFANEAIGRSFPRTGAFHPPVTLPSFDIAATERSIDTLSGYDADVVALSHVGVRNDPGPLFVQARRQLDRFRIRVPEIYDECGDLDAAIDRVREELLDLDDGYPDHVAAVQARVCTVGFLRATGDL